MLLRNFFAHLKGGSGGLEATYIVSLLSATLGRWAEDPRVPDQVNRLEDAQRKSVRESLPIDNKWLAIIATKSLLAVGRFPKQRPDWHSLPPRQQDVGGVENRFPRSPAHVRGVSNRPPGVAVWN